MDLPQFNLSLVEYARTMCARLGQEKRVCFTENKIDKGRERSL